MADATAADPSGGVWQQLHYVFFAWGFPSSLQPGSGLAPTWRRQIRARARLPPSTQTSPSREETVELLPHANGRIGGFVSILLIILQLIQVPLSLMVIIQARTRDFV